MRVQEAAEAQRLAQQLSQARERLEAERRRLAEER
jgi:hypothetical protein